MSSMLDDVRKNASKPQAHHGKALLHGLPGTGKALHVATPVPTPDGVKFLKDIKDGDMVIGADGQPCRVVKAHDSYTASAWRLKFSDGSAVVADDDHLWVTTTRSERVAGSEGKTRETREIVRTLRCGTDQRANHAIEVAEPADLPEIDLPLDPYTLGVWLGDGRKADAMVHLNDKDYPAIAKGLVNHHVVPSQVDANCSGYWLEDTQTTLREMGLLHNKHVPEQYLRGSIDQRLALLRGLVDTDGGAERSRVEFHTTTKKLAEAVYQLVASLGEQPYVSDRKAILNGKDYGPAFKVSWTPTRFMPSTLDRKNPTELSEAARTRRRYITEAKRKDNVEVRCLTVDSPDAQFLVGYNHLPTHNTQTAGTIAELGDTLFIYVRGEEGINTLTDHPNVDNITIHQVESVKEMDEIQNELALGGHGFKAVAIDGVSAYQTMVSKWLLGLPQDAPAKDRPATDYAYWGQLRDYFTDFFTFWYGLANSGRGGDAMHVVMTSQTKMLEDATGEERMQPELFKGPLAAAVSRSDLICYMHMGADPDDMSVQRHLVRIKPSAYVVAKTRCSPDTYDKLPEVLGTSNRFTLPKFLRTLNVAGT